MNDESGVYLETNGPRAKSSTLLCDGSRWIRVPMAVRIGRGSKAVTVWVNPNMEYPELDSLTDSGRSDSGSESEWCPE
jgi:hypothetical protein